MDVFLAEPRGFCAGVIRAVSIVREALRKYGAPVYVRHEIVHNKHVIAELEKAGAVFIEDLNEIQDLNRPVIFSAHGVSLSVTEEAKRRGLTVIDATCPLVSRVHQQIRKYADRKLPVIVIGKAGHPEIIGTAGQLPDGYPLRIISSKAEAETLDFSADEEIGMVTQTTLSVDDTAEITAYLQKRFSKLVAMKAGDICYATTNRQKAVKALAQKTDTVIIIGSANSSNSRQLKETALKAGAAEALLIDDAGDLDWKKLENCAKLGISAGASAPEYLVEGLLDNLRRHYDKIKIHKLIIAEEKVSFKI